MASRPQRAPQTSLLDEEVAAHALPTQQLRSRRSALRVITAAEQVIRQVGLEDLTMAAVAAEAKVSIGGIYRRFANKDALINAIHEVRVTQIPRAICARMDVAESLAEAVQGLADVQAHLFSMDEAVYKAIFSGGRSVPEKNRRAQQQLELAYMAFREALLRWRDEILHEDIEETIAFAYHAVTGAMMARVGRKPTPPFDQVDWDGLSARLGRSVYLYLTTPAPERN